MINIDGYTPSAPEEVFKADSENEGKFVLVYPNGDLAGEHHPGPGDPGYNPRAFGRFTRAFPAKTVEDIRFYDTKKEALEVQGRSCLSLAPDRIRVHRVSGFGKIFSMELDPALN